MMVEYYYHNVVEKCTGGKHSKWQGQEFPNAVIYSLSTLITFFLL